MYICGPTEHFCIWLVRRAAIAFKNRVLICIYIYIYIHTCTHICMSLRSQSVSNTCRRPHYTESSACLLARGPRAKHATATSTTKLGGNRGTVSFQYNISSRNVPRLRSLEPLNGIRRSKCLHTSRDVRTEATSRYLYQFLLEHKHLSVWCIVPHDVTSYQTVLYYMIWLNVNQHVLSSCPSLS